MQALMLAEKKVINSQTKSAGRIHSSPADDASACPRPPQLMKNGHNTYPHSPTWLTKPLELLETRRILLLLAFSARLVMVRLICPSSSSDNPSSLIISAETC